MKKTFLAFAFGFIFLGQIVAKKIDGYFITHSHDTMKVVFNIPMKLFSQQPNFEKLQYKVKYYGKAGKVLILRPDEATEINFTYGNQAIRMLSLSNSIGYGNNIFNTNSNIFLKLEIDGPLKMYRYYYTQSTPGIDNGATGGMTGGYTTNVEQYILQKGNGELKRPKAWSFKKDMKEYFEDCPALVERIDSKEFRRKEVESMVTFYNAQCK